jgi:hypothetical protein
MAAVAVAANHWLFSTHFSCLLGFGWDSAKNSALAQACRETAAPMLAHKSCCRNIKFTLAIISRRQLIDNFAFFLARFAISGVVRSCHRHVAADRSTKESICGQIVYTIRRHLKDNTWLS